MPMDTLLHYDCELFYAINHGLHHPWLTPLMWLFTGLGLGWVQLLIVLGATLVAQARACQQGVRFTPWRTTFVPALVAFASSGLTVQLLKRAVPRLRPSNLPGALVAPDEQLFHNSFPSGHTATAFALAFWLFMQVRGTRYRFWGYGALLVAGLVGLSRIYRGLHYPSDVLVGALIGVLWGAIAYFTLSVRCAVPPPAPESPPDSASASPRG
ncbi:MAG: phosphatase PAP2 family protein [Fimbriimonadales bacterium]|nr:phosphatase PAP2 family protein [Fimbriimonadales bacterium]MDW8052651.1 phosphatase PAP2 family protein [Armatimonadota bacterium]